MNVEVEKNKVGISELSLLLSIETEIKNELNEIKLN